jgi:DNA-binding CsgD family transcriptional regulator
LHLCFTNPAAETMLRRGDGLLVKNGRLATRWQADERQLAAAVSKVCTPPTITASSPPANRQSAAGIIVPIWRNEEHPPYRASVFRLRRDHAARALIPAAEGVLLVDDPHDDAAPAQADLYSRAFLLTPAEARLAVHLASGASLTEAADAFGVTHNTVRAQLRAVFDKTDTHRQTELVRLLQTSRSLRVSLT